MWYVNKDLGGAGIFECQKCGLRIGRQKNASRNMWSIFLNM
jgi:transposase